MSGLGLLATLGGVGSGLAVTLATFVVLAQDGAATGMRVQKTSLPLTGFAKRELYPGTETLAVEVHTDPVTELILWERHPVPLEDVRETRLFYVARTPPASGVHQITPEWRYVGGLEAGGWNYRVFEEPR